MDLGSEKAEVAVVSDKGQVVIPQAIRKSLGITPRVKLLVYEYRDVIMMKKLEVPDVRKTMERIWRRIDERVSKYGELTQVEIDEIIHAHRKRRRRYTKKAA